MSWAIKFIPYSEAKSGAGDHTITEFDFQLDPQSITGIDYYKQEPRMGEFDMFSDVWLEENYTAFAKGLGAVIPDTDYWYYVIRLEYNGNTKYIGYIRRDFVEYDKEFGECNFRTNDSYGILSELMQKLSYNEFFGGQIGGAVTGLLANTLSSVINFQFDGRIPLDILINQNYNLISGVQATNLPMYKHSEDPQLENAVNSNSHSNWDTWTWLDSDVRYPELGETTTAKNVLSIYVYDGKLSVVFMKYVQTLTGDTSWAHSYEELYVRYFDIEQNIVFTNKGFYYDTQFWAATYEDILEYQRTGSFSNGTFNLWRGAYANIGGHSTIKEGLETQLSPIFNYNIDDDNYAIDNIDGNTFYYSGVANISHVVINREKEKTFIEMCDFLLLLNNLCIVTEDNGDISINNKGGSNAATATAIDDNHVLLFKPAGILKSSPDYASMASVIMDSASIAIFLKEIYRLLFLTLTSEIPVEINNYYELYLFDKLTIYGEDYKIASINLDNDLFNYELKVWRV